MSSSDPHRLVPDRDEFEVSVFGPSYGESVVLHLGDGCWVVVDSCLDPAARSSAPLAYLRRIGVDVSAQVRMVVATHWHDDHIRGLSEVVEACSGAEFACPAALGHREFLSLIARYRRPSLIKRPGVSELNEILKELERRSSAHHRVCPMYGLEHRELISVPIREGAESSRIVALSPSDAAHENALLGLQKLVPILGDPKLKVLVGRPNHLAMALRVEALGQVLVLGSDLEVVADRGNGWTRVAEIEKRAKRARLLKVPHHGSSSAFSEEHWRHCMEEDAIAVVSPFIRGGIVLPTDDGLDRISRFSDRVFLTATPERMLAKFRDRAVAEMMEKATVGNVASFGRSHGSITMRARRSDPAEWEIYFRGSALRYARTNRSERVA